MCIEWNTIGKCLFHINGDRENNLGEYAIENMPKCSADNRLEWQAFDEFVKAKTLLIRSATSMLSLCVEA